jgi:hypothetical protein
MHYTPACSTFIDPHLLEFRSASELPIGFTGNGLLHYMEPGLAPKRQLSLFRAKRVGGIGCAGLILPLMLVGIIGGIENIPAGKSYGPLGPDPSSGWGYQDVYIQKTTPFFWTMVSLSCTSALTSVYCWITARATLKRSVRKYNRRLAVIR